MTSTVEYKFKSARTYDTVSFPGASIKVLDLKRAIVEAKNLNKGLDFDLVLTDAETKEVYRDNDAFVQRNTCIIVMRAGVAPNRGGLLRLMALTAPTTAPTPGGAQAGAADGSAPATGAAPGSGMGADGGGYGDGMSGHVPLEDTGDITDANVGEAEADLLARIAGGGRGRGGRFQNASWSSSGGSRGGHMGMGRGSSMGGGRGGMGRGRGGGGPGGLGRGGPGAGGRGGGGIGGGGGDGGGGAGGSGQRFGSGPPRGAVPKPGYICYRCGESGHFIQDCPTNDDPTYDRDRGRKKPTRATGIPKTLMRKVDASELRDLDPDAIVVHGEDGFALIQKNSDFARSVAYSEAHATQQTTVYGATVPAELMCPLCRGLMKVRDMPRYCWLLPLRSLVLDLLLLVCVCGAMRGALCVVACCGRWSGLHASAALRRPVSTAPFVVDGAAGTRVCKPAASIHACADHRGFDHVAHFDANGQPLRATTRVPCRKSGGASMPTNLESYPVMWF